MRYSQTLLEEELKNRVGEDFFADYNYSTIKGRIDFTVADQLTFMGEAIEYLWAEAKRGKGNLDHALVQLILTIGRAQLQTKQTPPPYLGAFDAEHICFIPYFKLHDIFSMNDFNWNVTPSDHTTKEFALLSERIKAIIQQENLTFDFIKDEKELHKFIKKNFVVGKEKTTKIPITKTNFITIYSKWEEAVRPTIAIDWECAKKQGIISADFYLADLLSREGLSLKDRLYVVLEEKKYRLVKGKSTLGIFEFGEIPFTDDQRAYNDFWNKYQRPPKKEYWDFLIGRRDLLVPQDVRERKGSYFTPRIWVELSQQYLADQFGDNWQEEYYVWDCAAGTGNLLNGLSEKYRIFASTLDQADVLVMKDRAANGANLLPEHIFQFDFLNDEFDCGKLPKALLDIIQDEEKRKKLIIYINPPYAEASNARTITRTGSNRSGVSQSAVYTRYSDILGGAKKELFAQFLMRIYRELPSTKIAEFSTLKILQSSFSQKFRSIYRAKLEKIFIVPAKTFDNVNGSFPIGFKIWDSEKDDTFTTITADKYNDNGVFIGKKEVYSLPSSSYVINWLRKFDDKSAPLISYIRLLGTDVQHSKDIYITSRPTANDIKESLIKRITINNLLPCCIYACIRAVIPQLWDNDRDNFLDPEVGSNYGWHSEEFQSDCLAYMLFDERYERSPKDTNHWIPFVEKEVNAPTLFSSHFITDFISGKLHKEVQEKETSNELFEHEAPQSLIPHEPMRFSPEAIAVFDAGRALWRYYFSQAGSEADPNVALYDIRLYFQGRNAKGKMNNDSPDTKYMELIGALRQARKILARKIEPKVYEHGFLPKLNTLS